MLVNHPDCVQAAMRAAEKVGQFTEINDVDLPMAGGEDFAYFAEKIPACYAFLGAGLPQGDTPGCHHPDFDFDDDLIPLGVRYWIEVLRDRLG